MSSGELRVLNSVTDPRMGGPQRRILDVAGRLKNRDIETELMVPHGDRGFVDNAEKQGLIAHQVRLQRLRSPTAVAENIKFAHHFWPSIKAIADLIRDRDIDVVHANMAINFQTSIAAVKTGTPLAWHYNDTLMPPPAKQVAGYLGRRWADEIVVAADAVHEYYFPSSTQSRTIYAPVNIDRFDPRNVAAKEDLIREDLGLPPDIPIVGTVGNINPIKGHEYILKAAAKLIKEGQEIAVPIVGAELNSRKRYAAKLHNLRKQLGLEDNVRFVGFRSDIPELLSVFDIFALPSIAEACPIVVLEAMAMKCPVIATDVGGIPEQIPSEDYGWVVPPEDSQTLADTIQNAIGDPAERRRRAENAYDRVRTEFSLKACVDRHEELYWALAEC